MPVTINGLTLSVGPLNIDKSIRVLDAIAVIVSSSQEARLLLNTWVAAVQETGEENYRAQLIDQLAVIIPRIWMDSRFDLAETIAACTLEPGQLEEAEREDRLAEVVKERSRLIRHYGTPDDALNLMGELVEAAQRDLHPDVLGESLSGLGSIFTSLIENNAEAVQGLARSTGSQNGTDGPAAKSSSASPSRKRSKR